MIHIKYTEMKELTDEKKMKPPYSAQIPLFFIMWYQI